MRRKGALHRINAEPPLADRDPAFERAIGPQAGRPGNGGGRLFSGGARLLANGSDWARRLSIAMQNSRSPPSSAGLRPSAWLRVSGQPARGLSSP